MMAVRMSVGDISMLVFCASLLVVVACAAAMSWVIGRDR